MAEEDFYDQDRGEAELEDRDIDEGDEWKVIEAYFTSSSQVLVKQQLDSFDTFCISSINEIIRDAEVASVKIDPNNPADRVCCHGAFSLSLSLSSLSLRVFDNTLRSFFFLSGRGFSSFAERRTLTLTMKRAWT